MPVSDAAINSAKLGNDVNHDIYNFLQDWQHAGAAAVQGLHPDDKSSGYTWAICLIGNLAWAATVFLAPEFAVAEAVIATKLGAGAKTVTEAGIAVNIALRSSPTNASPATKAVSLLGAALGTDVVGKLGSLESNSLAAKLVGDLRRLGGDLTSADGKDFLEDYLGSQIPRLREVYVAGADAWVKSDLLDHMLAQYASRSRPNPNEDIDAGFSTFCGSAVGADVRQRYVWEKYVFCDPRTPYYDKPDGKGGKAPGGMIGLKRLIRQHLESALKDFNQQWKKYQSDARNYAQWTGEARFYLAAREMYMRNHPFNPVLKYSGVPDKLQIQQQSNQTKLGKFAGAND